jgi:UDPglucose 6-dehydrogenase
MVLVEALLTRGARVAVYDALAERHAKPILRERVDFSPSLYEACAGAQALVIANDDRSFTQIDWRRVAHCLYLPNIVDLRNRLDAAAMRRAGLRYTGVGRARKEIFAS